MYEQYSAKSEFSAYHDDSVKLEKKYQLIMDWSIWFEEYVIRADKDNYEQENGLANDNTTFIVPPYINGYFHNSELIINILMAGKVLISSKLMSRKGINKYFFESFPRIPIYGHADSVITNDYSRKLNRLLVEIEQNIEALVPLQFDNKKINPKVAVFETGTPLADLESQAEEVWLRWQGRELEAQLVRLARIFEKKTTPARDNGNMPRAIGLWLWDFIEMNRVQGVHKSMAEAVSAFSDKFDSTGLFPKDKAPSDEHLIFYLKCTCRCIKTGTVLPFTKKTARGVFRN